MKDDVKYSIHFTNESNWKYGCCRPLAVNNVEDALGLLKEELNSPFNYGKGTKVELVKEVTKYEVVETVVL